MKKAWSYVTPVGDFTIVEETGLFIPYFRGVALGFYTNPQFAADDLSDGHATPHPSGIDTSALGIPHDLDEWRVFEESE